MGQALCSLRGPNNLPPRDLVSFIFLIYWQGAFIVFD